MQKTAGLLLAATMLAGAFVTPASAWDGYKKYLEENKGWQERAFGGLPGHSIPCIGCDADAAAEFLGSTIINIGSSFLMSKLPPAFGQVFSIGQDLASMNSQKQESKAPPPRIVNRDKAPSQAQFNKMMDAYNALQKKVQEDKGKVTKVPTTPKSEENAPAVKKATTPPAAKVGKDAPAAPPVAMLAALGNKIQIARLEFPSATTHIAELGSKLQTAYEALPFSTRLALNTKSVALTGYVLAMAE